MKFAFYKLVIALLIISGNEIIGSNLKAKLKTSTKENTVNTLNDAAPTAPDANAIETGAMKNLDESLKYLNTREEWVSPIMYKKMQSDKQIAGHQTPNGLGRRFNIAVEPITWNDRDKSASVCPCETKGGPCPPCVAGLSQMPMDPNQNCPCATYAHCPPCPSNYMGLHQFASFEAFRNAKQEEAFAKKALMEAKLFEEAKELALKTKKEEDQAKSYAIEMQRSIQESQIARNHMLRSSAMARQIAENSLHSIFKYAGYNPYSLPIPKANPNVPKALDSGAAHASILQKPTPQNSMHIGQGVAAISDIGVNHIQTYGNPENYGYAFKAKTDEINTNNSNLKTDNLFNQPS